MAELTGAESSGWLLGGLCHFTLDRRVEQPNPIKLWAKLYET